jgi:hypothetical protein
MQLSEAPASSDTAHLLCLLAHRVERLVSYHAFTTQPQQYRDFVRSIESELIKLAKELG